MPSPRSGIEVVRNAPAVGRVMREPEHPFLIGQIPWAITPFFIAPVVPGETMKNLLLNARCQSGVALKSNFVGWFHEVYFFYVKHRDMPLAEEIMAMHLGDGNLDNLITDTQPWCYNSEGGGVNWVRQCLSAVVDHYFRDEDETHEDGILYGLPACHLTNPSGALQSAVVDLVNGDAIGDQALPGEEPYDDARYATLPPEFQAQYRAWQDMTQMRLTTATFEDYLKSFGVRPPRELRVEQIAKPELVRYIRQWKYPDISMVDGTAAPSFRLDIQERADKDRFLAEPGFLFGVTVIKPKTYLQNQTDAASMLLDDAYGWLPAVLRDEAYTSLLKVDVSDGWNIYEHAAPETDPDYWIDRKDLFVHGDQFINFAKREIAGVPTWPNFVDMFDDATKKCRYLQNAEAALNALFAGWTVTPGGTWPSTSTEPMLAPFFTDGIVRPSILSRIEDTSL